MPPDSTGIETILVVDDNVQNRAVLEGHLVARGYAVSMAESGQEALDRFQERTSDLVLLDVLMPGMDGFETCRRLRALPGGDDTPIVFVTALSDLGTHRTAMDSGADDYLTKPVNRTELLLRVRSLIRIKRMSRNLQSSHELIRGQRDALLRLQKQKDELAALVVHDLKNPLAAILANLHYLARESYFEEDHREAMRDVLGATDAMHRMVLDLLDISRSEDGTLAPKLAEFDLSALIEEICATLRRRIEDYKLELAVDVAVKGVRADKDLLRRLIENLLDNCIKYTPSGGVIRLRARTCGEKRFEVRVYDQGPGVPQDYRERIFEKYVQLDRDAGTHARASRGLGLAFCRLAAEAHGGRIWVEDNRPKGSTFCVELPSDVG